MSHEMRRHKPWPFPGDQFPRDLGAVVQQTVLRGDMPALLVIHRENDDWLVGDGTNDPNEPGASLATHMWHVLERNSSVHQLATLAPGYQARREAPGCPWVIGPIEWASDPE